MRKYYITDFAALTQLSNHKRNHNPEHFLRTVQAYLSQRFPELMQQTPLLKRQGSTQPLEARDGNEGDIQIRNEIEDV